MVKVRLHSHYRLTDPTHQRAADSTAVYLRTVHCSAAVNTTQSLSGSSITHCPKRQTNLHLRQTKLSINLSATAQTQIDFILFPSSCSVSAPQTSSISPIMKNQACRNSGSPNSFLSKWFHTLTRCCQCLVWQE